MLGPEGEGIGLQTASRNGDPHLWLGITLTV
jgi:hypothetical protein